MQEKCGEGISLTTGHVEDQVIQSLNANGSPWINLQEYREKGIPRRTQNEGHGLTRAELSGSLIF